MKPHVVAGADPSVGADAALGSTAGAHEQHEQQHEPLTTVESYLLDALERLDAAEVKALQLETALEHSRDIGAAIGILMALHRLTRQQAFDMLRETSMARNVKLHALAARVVETGSLEDA